MFYTETITIYIYICICVYIYIYIVYIYIHSININILKISIVLCNTISMFEKIYLELSGYTIAITQWGWFPRIPTIYGEGEW